MPIIFKFLLYFLLKYIYKININEKKIVDILKINHWLNVRKVTINYIFKRNKTLANKIKLKKNFFFE